jgi:hypothetical protein
MNWKYNNKDITDISQFLPDTFGFVYIITHLPSQKSYIGKKVLYHNLKVKLTKNELKLHENVRGRKPTHKYTSKESDWKTYWGSSKPLLEIVNTELLSNFEKIILKLAPNKKLLTYYETKYLFEYNVLENPDKYFNNNILGSFYTKDFEI